MIYFTNTHHIFRGTILTKAFKKLKYVWKKYQQTLFSHGMIWILWIDMKLLMDLIRPDHVIAFDEYVTVTVLIKEF